MESKPSKQVWKPVLSSSSMEDQNPPTNDSLFLQAKRAQLVEKDPERAIELFKLAIDSGDRVESALKDMVYVMKGLGRIDEAIKEMKNNWELCSRSSPQSEASLINVLINLYEVWKPVPSSSSMEDQILPTNDSLFLQAKRAQLVERDPEKAIELFKYAIDSGDRVERALKDMVHVMKGLGRIDEAIEAIKKNWNLCSPQSEESLINVLINLYELAGRIDEQIELLHRKIKLIEEGKAFGGTGTKTVKVGGRVLHIPIIREKSRLLGNLAWLYMLKKNYRMAEPLYREALSIELDKNNECNLAICLMYEGRRVSEARSILQAVRHSSEVQGDSSYLKSYNRACNVLMEVELQSIQTYPPQPFPPPQHPHHHFRDHYLPPQYLPPHHLPQHPPPPPHHLPQHPQPFQPRRLPPLQHPYHHFPDHYLPPHHFPQHLQPRPPHHHLPQHPQPSQPRRPPPPPPQPSQPRRPPPPPPQHPPIFDVNPMVSPYDDFDNQYSFMSTFEGLEMVPWRRRGI